MTEDSNRDIGSRIKSMLPSSGAVAAFAIVAAAIGANSYKIVPAQSYGVDIRFGQLKSDHMQPGIYWKVPFFEKIYTLNNNTIILDSNGIGTGDNSSDQNAITADFRLHYKINPTTGSLALNIDKIANNHGKGVMADLENQALNAAVGSRPATDTLADPQGFMKAFKSNLEWRISQNNLSFEIDSIELLTLYVGASSSSSSSHSEGRVGLRKVIQMRILSNGEVQQMSGPAAVSVASSTSVVAPTQLTVKSTTTVAGPTVPTAPLPSATTPPTVQP